MADVSNPSATFESAADADTILNGGQPGTTMNQILLAILLELRMLRAAAVEPEQGSGV